jgi:hypothetical protein
MSFLQELIEENTFETELKQWQTELREAEEFLNSIKFKISEGIDDFGDRTEGEIFDEAIRRMEVLKYMFGLVNKLSRPDDRRKHRSQIAGHMNKLRALIKKLTLKFTEEVKKDEEAARGQRQERDPRRTERRPSSTEFTRRPTRF